jgi:hypothetical protein
VSRAGAAEAVWDVKAVLPQIKNAMAKSIKNEPVVVAMNFFKKLLLWVREYDRDPLLHPPDERPRVSPGGITGPWIPLLYSYFLYYKWECVFLLRSS